LAEHTTQVEDVVEAPGSAKTIVAWTTAAVLTLLLILCVATVRSIVVPVRNLKRAIARIAGGSTDARVPRGGIKELDGLAVVFNQMADELATARAVANDHQHRLEERVEERTQQLQHLANHDPLTQLPNRRQLFVLLDAALTKSIAENRLLGVFFLDLDNFKTINDSMGHTLGDKLLLAIAQRLRETVEPWGFVARFGGDEFTVVYGGAPSVELIREAGWNLIRAFQRPFVVEGSELLVSVSVGASLYPDHHDTADALLRAADAALFRAKALGRSQLAEFTPELLEAAASRFTTEQGLRRAVDRGEFELVFQPEVSTGSLEVGLVEALLRWRLPDGRHALPGEFLAIAEESGLIMEISDWVLREAIAAAARWHFGDWPAVRVAINVSSRQLLDHRFVDNVLALLAEHRLPPRCIEIELTESVLQTGAATLESLRRLRAEGIAIALDDFGTGYSSIASLVELPITRIKLDRSLIADIDQNGRALSVAKALIGLCHDLGLEITAEGIETPEQFAHLLAGPPIVVQGFLLARPVAEKEIAPLLQTIPVLVQELILQGASPTPSAKVRVLDPHRPIAKHTG
jgi:diguanylate cyclase (GGDEF)-like protein